MPDLKIVALYIFTIRKLYKRLLSPKNEIGFDWLSLRIIFDGKISSGAESVAYI